MNEDGHVVLACPETESLSWVSPGPSHSSLEIGAGAQVIPSDRCATMAVGRTGLKGILACTSIP